MNDDLHHLLHQVRLADPDPALKLRLLQSSRAAPTTQPVSWRPEFALVACIVLCLLLLAQAGQWPTPPSAPASPHQPAPAWGLAEEALMQHLAFSERLNRHALALDRPSATPFPQRTLP